MSTHTTLASRLADARSNKILIDDGPYNRLSSTAEAYRLQDLASAAYPSRQCGYKVGATSEVAQKLFSCDGPFYGPMFEQDRYEPGAHLELQKGIVGGEAEFAFVCGTDFPTHTDLAIDDLPDLISSCHTAVEIVGRRTTGNGLPGLHSAIADFGVHVAFIPGPAIANWRTIDLSKIEVTATTNGIETNSGTGAAVLGHPLQSLLWMHNALRSIGSGLKAGDWVSTGTCLGVIAAVPGRVNIEFSGCNTIHYGFN